MSFKRARLLVLSTLGLVLISAIFLMLWFSHLDKAIRSRLSQGWFLPPIEFYSSAERIMPGLWMPPSELQRKLEGAGLVAAQAGDQHLRSGEFRLESRESCQQHFTQVLADEVATCMSFWPQQGSLQLAAIAAAGKILAIFSGPNLESALSLSIPPILFAQYYGPSPVLRRILELGDVPLECLEEVIQGAIASEKIDDALRGGADFMSFLGMDKILAAKEARAKEQAQPQP